MLEYKGYTGVMDVDDEAGILFGRVFGLRDVITFQGETIEEARQAFRDSVDDYLEFCEELGRPAEKPFSGKFLLRVKPELHRALANSAEIRGASLNGLVERLLTDAVRTVGEAGVEGGSAPARSKAREGVRGEGPARPRKRTPPPRR